MVSTVTPADRAEAMSPTGASLPRRLVRDRTALVGFVILAVLFAAALLAPVLTPHDPAATHIGERFASPSLEHPLGTDHLGRDELTRILFGARVSLLTVIAVGLATLAIGTTIGLISGFLGGLVDGAIMRVVDVLLAFPSLLLALVVTGFLGPGLLNLALAVTLVAWVDYARVVRGLVLGVKERLYVESARALGLPPHTVALRHVLPNIVGPVIVLATLQSGQLLLALAALSFLGLGVSPPTAEWGTMLNEAKNYLAVAPELMVYPGLAIAIAGLGFNLLGDGLRDVLDPTLR